MMDAQPKIVAEVVGRPGGTARAWGLWHALMPMGPVLFLAGVALGSAWRPEWLSGAAAGGLFLLLVAALGGLMLRARRRLERHDRGVRGEEATAAALARLPGEWTVFHGVPFPKGGGGGRDADHVAVGPGGVFWIETINWSGRVSLEEGVLLDSGRAYPGFTVADFEESASRLRTLPGLEGLTSVGCVVCSVGGRLAPMPADTPLTVCGPAELPERLLRAPGSLSPAQVEAAVQALRSWLRTQAGR